MICLVKDTAQTLVEEEFNVDQKHWVDDLLGEGSRVEQADQPAGEGGGGAGRHQGLHLVAAPHKNRFCIYHYSHI